MKSRLFECRVMHHRFSPKRHHFTYSLFMLAVHLDELDELARSSRLLGVNRRGLFSFRERDHLPVSTAPTLRARVEQFLRAKGAAGHPASIEVITMPRVAGYLFNPVSFYFCRDDSGAPVAAIAEVTNTFREVKPFLLDESCWNGRAFRLRVPKHFYVSPFSDVDVEFDFVLRPADDRLSVQIDDYSGGERTLTSTIAGRARPLSDRVLLACSLKYPLLTLKVIAAIHWQALLLYLKRVPWFAKAARVRDQRNLFKPHHSLPAGRSGASQA